MLRFIFSIFIPLSLIGAAAGQAPATPAQLEQFQVHNPDSSQVLDFEAWTEILNDIVLRVPASRRVAARGRPTATGSNIYRGNSSRYRFEGNRVIYHLMDDSYEQAIRDFRIAMEDLPNRLDFGSLNSDQQLAYWLNLHNAAAIEQVISQYPESRINRTRAVGSSESMFEAKILNVAGVPLSLDDIRIRIVYAQWADPRVIYGFHNGAIGGPNIRREAFRGAGIWSQLDSNATDFVNSLRGVEIDDRNLRVSQIYGEARELFPDFDTDLRTHLVSFANDNTALQLEGNRPIITNVEEWHIADMTNGVIGCTGSGSPMSMVGSSNPNVVNLATLDCNILPETGLVLVQYMFEQRLRLLRDNQLGTVETIDIETPDDQPVINMAPSFGGNREELPEG